MTTDLEDSEEVCQPTYQHQINEEDNISEAELVANGGSCLNKSNTWNII